MASTPEQKAFPILSRFGFVPCQDEFFAETFFDKEDTEFHAKPDYKHPELNIYVEVKDSSLNSKTSKRMAENAYRRIDPYRLAKSPTYYQIKNQWNHSAAKQSIVQHTLGGADRFIVVFTGKPDSKTLELIEKHGLHAYSLDKFSLYMSMWKLFNTLISNGFGRDETMPA